MADVLAGHVNMVFDTMPSAMPQVRGNKLRPIGISSLTRHPSLPDVPTIAETLPGYEYISWYGLFAPAGTPPAIVERLNAEVHKVLASPEVIEKFKTSGIDVNSSSSADFSNLVKAEVPKWRKVIQQSGAKVD
jgi:tripartite-type tricarboxylate transporter receptor subunit TctC